MPKLIDLTGKRFGRLVVIERTAKGNLKGPFWKCQCDCGNIAVVLGSNLKRHLTTSCGCFHKEIMLHHGLSRTKTYKGWSAMLQRCENPKHKHYSYYGGRGIKVCDEWHTFINFYNDMGERPEGAQLDRIDNNKGYSKDNCHWVTRFENMANTRKNVYITYNGKTLIQAEWARLTGINTSAICRRLKTGWTLEETLTIPVSSSNRIIKGERAHDLHR